MARRGIKRAFEWKYVDGTVTLTVPVFVVNRDEQSDRGGYFEKDKPTTYFRVQMEDPEIDEHDVNIDELKKRVFAGIKQKLEIPWRDVLHVEVDGDRERLFKKKTAADTKDTEASARVNVSVHWTRHQIAEVRGKKVSRRFQSWYEPTQLDDNHRVIKLPGREQFSSMSDGWPDTGRPTDRWNKADKTRIAALVPDTPENRLALEQIADGFDQLHKRLMGLLAPKAIEKTLANIGDAGLMLPAPAAPEIFGEDTGDDDEQQDDDLE
jgi:hypothetical protein